MIPHKSFIEDKSQQNGKGNENSNSHTKTFLWEGFSTQIVVIVCRIKGSDTFTPLPNSGFKLGEFT